MNNTIRFILLVSFLQTALALTAQYRPVRIFKHGQADARMGIGLLPTYSKDASRVVAPPVSVGFDWMAGDVLSIGFTQGYSHYEIEKLWNGDKTIRRYATRTWQSFFRFAAHYTRTDNLDIYGGMQAGGEFVAIRSVDHAFGPAEALHGIKPRRFRLQYGAFFGTRFAVSHKLLIWGELGTSISFVQTGIGMKLW